MIGYKNIISGRKKYYVANQTTIAYEKWYMEAYVLMNPIIIIFLWPANKEV